MPQPFKRLSNQKLSEGLRVVETRPKCAVKMATVAAEWTRVEYIMADIFGTVTGKTTPTGADTVMHSNNVPALAALRAIQNLNTRISVFKAATEAILHNDQREEFEQISKTLRKRAGERNDIVHGYWCAVETYPDDLLLCVDGAHGTTYLRYTEKDFDEIIDRITAICKMLDAFGSRWLWTQFAEHIPTIQKPRARVPPPPSD